MSLPKPQYIANLLVIWGSNTEFKKIEQVLNPILLNKFQTWSEEQVWDYIDQYTRDIANELFSKETENQIEGISSNFNLIQEDNGYYIKFYDKPELGLLRQLQENTSENFEMFCKRILEKLGGTSTVTGGKDDGGIDFEASNLKLNNLPFLSTKGSKIFLIGQAKNFSGGNHVKETDLREFIGACIKKVEDYKRTRPEQYGIFQPIILAFWTTTDFHVKAKDFAKDFGIWYLNGIALAQLAIKIGIESV